MFSFTPPSLYLLGGQHSALDVSSLASAGPSVVFLLNLVKTTKLIFFDTSVRLDRRHVLTEGSTVRLSSSQWGGGRWTASYSVHCARGCVGPQPVCALRRRRRPLFLPGVKPWCSGRCTDCTVVRPDGQSVATFGRPNWADFPLKVTTEHARVAPFD